MRRDLDSPLCFSPSISLALTAPHVNSLHKWDGLLSPSPACGIWKQLPASDTSFHSWTCLSQTVVSPLRWLFVFLTLKCASASPTCILCLCLSSVAVCQYKRKKMTVRALNSLEEGRWREEARERGTGHLENFWLNKTSPAKDLG